MSSDHVVKVYDDDQDLGCGVSGFVAAGIAADDLVLVVATPEHRAAFARAARAAAVGLPAASAAGQYLALDAREMLATFMADGVPDPARFGEVIGGLLRRAAPRRVRIFGPRKLRGRVAVDDLEERVGPREFKDVPAHGRRAFASLR